MTPEATYASEKAKMAVSQGNLSGTGALRGDVFNELRDHVCGVTIWSSSRVGTRRFQNNSKRP